MTAPVNGNTVPSNHTDSPIARLLFRFRRWIVAVLIPLWLAAVTASHIPQEHLPPLPVNGKILHFLGFFGLATLFVLALAAYGKGALRRNLWALLVLSAYAAFDEGTQPYFHRHGCVSDWVLDTSSATLALVLWQAMLLAVKLLVKHTHRARQAQLKINSYLDALCRKL
jgi:VanZ family protein